MAVYEVKSPDGKVQLVECRTSKGAIAHVATKGYTTNTLKMSDVVKRVKAGEQIESIEEEKAVEGNAATTATVADATAAIANGSEEAKPDEGSNRSFAGRFTKKAG